MVRTRFIISLAANLVIALSFSTPALSQENTIAHVVAEGVTKPLPIYSHATIYQGLVHVSGIQGFIPGTFLFPAPDAATQAAQALENLKTVLEQSSSSLDRILKMNLYFVDMDADFPSVNDVINRYFPKDPPARSSVAVAKLPRQARFVIDCVAAANEPRVHETAAAK